ncbi:MAG: hypothetical protein KDD46_04375 [Bdellovibrionales bacterium]|nr:hypothetical protein [Bdellovibrionales bacterium]
MSAVRVQKPNFKDQMEEILFACKKKIAEAHRNYQKDLSDVSEEVKDAIDMLALDKPFS